jgi:hypothetical protein
MKGLCKRCDLHFAWMLIPGGFGQDVFTSFPGLLVFSCDGIVRIVVVMMCGVALFTLISRYPGSSRPDKPASANSKHGQDTRTTFIVYVLPGPTCVF